MTDEELYLCCLHHRPGQWRRGSGWRRVVQTVASLLGNKQGAPGVPCLQTPSDGWRWAGDHRGWWMPARETKTTTVKFRLWCVLVRVDVDLLSPDRRVVLLPVLWQLCSHWWGSADTSYRMPSSVFLESTDHPVEEGKPKKYSHHIIHIKHQCNSEKLEGVTDLPRSSLRWLCKIPKDYIMGTLKWMDDYLLKKNTYCWCKIAILEIKNIINLFICIMYLFRHVSVFYARVEKLEVAGKEIPPWQIMCTWNKFEDSHFLGDMCSVTKLMRKSNFKSWCEV